MVKVQSGGAFTLTQYYFLSAPNTLSKALVYLGDNFIFLQQNDAISTINTALGKTIDLNAASSSIQDNADLWGSVTAVDRQTLSDADLLRRTPSEIVADPALLNQLVNYSGGWSVDPVTGLPTAQPIIYNVRTTGSTVSFEVALKFINDKYYGSAAVDPTLSANATGDTSQIIQNAALAIPSFSYDGFATLAPWVIPTIAAGVVVLVVIFVVVGVLVAISANKNKKMMQKGFATSNKKVDTLTVAVGSVYQKIIKQTKDAKKPQMLRAAKKPASSGPKAPTKPTRPAAPRPAAKPPGGAPKRPA